MYQSLSHLFTQSYIYKMLVEICANVDTLLTFKSSLALRLRRRNRKKSHQSWSNRINISFLLSKNSSKPWGQVRILKNMYQNWIIIVSNVRHPSNFLLQRYILLWVPFFLEDINW